jgi:hypothetical protein
LSDATRRIALHHTRDLVEVDADRAGIHGQIGARGHECRLLCDQVATNCLVNDQRAFVNVEPAECFEHARKRRDEALRNLAELMWREPQLQKILRDEARAIAQPITDACLEPGCVRKRCFERRLESVRADERAHVVVLRRLDVDELVPRTIGRVVERARLAVETGDNVHGLRHRVSGLQIEGQSNSADLHETTRAHVIEPRGGRYRMSGLRALYGKPEVAAAVASARAHFKSAVRARFDVALVPSSSRSGTTDAARGMHRSPPRRSWSRSAAARMH